MKKQFTALDTIVFRNTAQYEPDNLGLGRIGFALQALPNVRRVVFESLGGYRPNDPLHSDPAPFLPRPELKWPALPRIQEIFIPPYTRNSPVPSEGIRNMVQLCKNLHKFVFQLTMPDED
ncbi:hypothetical protein VHEMI06617 [[Torrubiella] hemipterigena]|uniref:Uncharacterized protein n=1 Tax=[Torrubiella] hemipterigena TaxID=1531966 RepID=A0A0A1T7T5_9HYPO|nr:hypothetical protein VHEMI06617 [[Torrubiella] hemipterigena]